MTVNDERYENKENLRNIFRTWDHIYLDYYTPDTLSSAPFKLTVNKSNLLTGQLAFWYSAISSLGVAPGLVIEDDALVLFPVKSLRQQLQLLPSDADFAALCLPLDELGRYEDTNDESFWCPIWQTKATAATYYTERGAQRIRELVARDGIIDQYDGQIMTYARQGELNGYTTRGNQPPVISTDGSSSQIQYTDWYNDN